MIFFDTATHGWITATPIDLPKPPYGWDWQPLTPTALTKNDEGDWFIGKNQVTYSSSGYHGARFWAAGPVEYTRKGWFSATPTIYPKHYERFMDDVVPPAAMFFGTTAKRVYLVDEFRPPLHGGNLTTIQLTPSEAEDYLADRDAVDFKGLNNWQPFNAPARRPETPFRIEAGQVALYFDPCGDRRRVDLVICY